MFTGIIQEIGEVQSLKKISDTYSLTLSCPKDWLSHSVQGDSIAVNGVCLTITSLTPSSFSADLAPSTIEKTALKNLQPLHKVNLEKAMTLKSFLGGHIVQGHVNGLGVVRKITNVNNCHLLEIVLPEELLKYCIAEGSIAIDGVSLTLSNIVQHTIEMNIIPHTWEKTILSNYRVGQLVNVEVDIIAKYMEKWLSPWIKNFQRS